MGDSVGRKGEGAVAARDEVQRAERPVFSVFEDHPEASLAGQHAVVSLLGALERKDLVHRADAGQGAESKRVLRIDALDGSFAAFVDHSLFEENGRTRVVYNGYIETRRVPLDEVNRFDYKTADSELMQYLDECNELLKELVEERWPATER